MSVRALVRSSDDIFRMPSIEARATQSNCYYYCCWYYCSYAMCVGQHSWHQSWAASSCYFPSQPTSVLLWGKQAQSLKSAVEARSPDMESVERQEQMAFGLCAGGFLFPITWVLGVFAIIMAPCAQPVMQSLRKPTGPTAWKRQLEGAHFKGSTAGVTSRDLKFHCWLCPHESGIIWFISLPISPNRTWDGVQPKA